MYKHLLSLFGEVTHINEFDIIRGNTNILNKVSHLSICGFIQIGEDTIFELRVMDLTVVISDFLVNSNFEGSLISKDVLKLGFVNWHSLLFSVVKLCALKAVSILGVEIFLFTKLC